MNAAAMPAPAETFKTQVATYHYDQPRYTICVGEVDASRFLLLLLPCQFTTLLIYADAVSFGTAALMPLLMLVAAGSIAYRLATLQNYEVAWWETVKGGVSRYLWLSGWLWVGQMFAHACDGIWGIGFLTRIGFYLAVGYVLVKVYQFDVGQMAYDLRKAASTLPRVEVSTTYLRIQSHEARDARGELNGLPLFDADTPELVAAWEKKNAVALEALLKAGDELNRQSWQAAIDRFNTVGEGIDLARGRLRYLVKEVEATLARYQIDYQALGTCRSGVLEGEMHQAKPNIEKQVRQTQYSVRFFSQTAARAMTGSLPWQAAAAAAALTVVIHYANHQKMLRQFKEHEGVLKTQAAAVQGDIDLIKAELDTRMLPQFDGLVAMIDRLEGQSAELTSAFGDAQGKALALAMTFVEAKYLLETKAGD